MTRNKILALALLLASSAHAEEVVYVTPVIPDEATKRQALMFGYILNGNDMSTGFVDVSGPVRCMMKQPDPELIGPVDPNHLENCFKRELGK
jgi:hypothetical protein